MDAKHTLTVLDRLASRRPGGALRLEQAFSGRLERLATVALDVAVETGDPIGRILADQLATSECSELTLHLVELFESDTYQFSVPLREAALTATRKALVTRRLAWPHPTVDQQAELARLAHCLGRRMRDLGEFDEALEITREAVEIRLAVMVQIEMF